MTQQETVSQLQQRFASLDMWPFKVLDKKRNLVEFSPCTMEDTEALISMYDTFEPKAAVQGLPPIDAATRNQWIYNNLEMNLAVKAECNGVIIAQGALSPFPGAKMAEYVVFVHNEHQNRGLGNIMSRVMISAAKKMNLEKVWVNESRSNSRAVNLYLKYGFIKTADELREIELELDLSTVEDTIDQLFDITFAPPEEDVAITCPSYNSRQEVFEETSSIFLFSSQFEKFKLPEDHPFKTERSRLVLDALNRYRLANISGTQILSPFPIDEESLLAAHDPQYLYYLNMADRGGFMPIMFEHGIGTSDNPVLPGVLDYALLVAGSSVIGADMLVSNPAVNLVFGPTGGLHHAGYSYAAGFCYINDAVLAIKYLLQNGFKKILYVDIDAHHGDGVQFAFYDDPRVLNISLHESGRTLFPWNSGFENELGEKDGHGYNINIPLPPGTNDDLYASVFNKVVPPIVEKFQPDVTVAVVGVDTMYADPMTNLSLTNNGFVDTVSKITKFAPKTLLLGGGGYNKDVIARTWTLMWAVLHDAEPRDEYFGQMGRIVDTYEVATGALRDNQPFIMPVKMAEAAAEVDRITSYMEKVVFPIHSIKP